MDVTFLRHNGAAKKKTEVRFDHVCNLRTMPPAARGTAADLPHSNLLDIGDKSADAWFGVRGSVDGLLGVRVLQSVRTGADGTRARRRGSAARKQDVHER